jgi:hypothetical protein
VNTLKTAFLLAAAAIAPSIAHADIIDIAALPGAYYDSFLLRSDASALLVKDEMMGPSLFWSASTGRLTGSVDALTIPNVTRYNLVGFNQSGSKIFGTPYDAVNGTYKAIIWNPSAATYLDILNTLGPINYASFGTNGPNRWAVNADATRAYGTYTQGGITKVFRWDQTDGVTANLIGSLYSGNDISVRSMSSDGNEIIGDYYPSNIKQTFYWSQATGAIDIGNSLGWGANIWTYSQCMSSNGGYVFVNKYSGFGVLQTYRWKASDYSSVELIKPVGVSELTVRFSSAAGDKVFGTYYLSGGYRLFKWTEAGGTTPDLASSLPAGNTGLSGVSSDLRYLYGYFVSGYSYHSFRYDDTTSTTLDLQQGLISGNYFPSAMSPDGKYIVGQKDNNIGWRWSAVDGYQTVSSWLLANGADPTIIGNWTFTNAGGISNDGKTVVGKGTLSGTTRYYIASAASGVADYEIWLGSINGQNRISATGSTLAGLPLEGAHHRPMLSFDRMGKESQAWATGDFGSTSRTRDVHVTSGEAGINWNVGKTMLFGVAGGHAVQNADLDLGGSSATKGDFFIAELDYRPEGTQWIVSLLGMVGSWESKTNRGYDNGAGTDFSSGVADTITRSARLRVDAPAVATFGGFGFAPFASYTVTQTVVGAYTETGGGLPASFNEQEHNATEARLGVTASKDLSEKTKLILSVEGIHRFDGAGPSLTGQDVTGGVSFDLPGTAPRADCVRFGFDVDHKLSADTLLNISAHVSTVGEAHDVSAAISIRRAF